MTPPPKPATWTAAVVLAGIALLGIWLGANRGSPGFGDFGGATYTTTSASGARTTMAEPPPPTPALDETAIRKIAHEEALAALTQGRPAAHRAAAAVSDDTSDSSDNGDQSGDTAGAVPGAAPAHPATTTPATPAATPTPPPTSGPPDL